jgi:hypothetical protein
LPDPNSSVLRARSPDWGAWERSALWHEKLILSSAELLRGLAA